MIAPTSRPDLCSQCTSGNVGACVYAAYAIGRGPCLDRRTCWDAGVRRGVTLATEALDALHALHGAGGGS